MNKQQWKINYLVFSFITAFLLGFMSQARAQDLYPTLMVVNVKASPDLEKNHDKMYLHILEYNSDHSARTFTVPKLPLLWPSSHIASMDNLEIWSGILREQQSASLVVSVMERNVLPWNTDHLIGVMTINFKNDQGKLTSEWSIPNRNDVPETLQKFGLTTHQVKLNKDINKLSIDFSMVEEKQIPILRDRSKNALIQKN